MQLIQSLKGGGGSAELHQMHKQQVEYSEAIESLRKKMEYTEKVALENKETLQVNIKLAGELEDYRSQTKRLIHDIQQKDQELIALRQAVAQKPTNTNEVSLPNFLSLWWRCLIAFHSFIPGCFTGASYNETEAVCMAGGGGEACSFTGKGGPTGR